MAGDQHVCRDSASPRYRDFGALGIAVCADWAGNFERFAEDMGERPIGPVLTRIDRDEDFTPDDGRWVALRPRSLRASESWNFAAQAYQAV